MTAGACALTIMVNALGASPALAPTSFLTCLLAGALITGNHCIEHEGEIPTREQRRVEAAISEALRARRKRGSD
jgi:hypothetical protein